MKDLLGQAGQSIGIPEFLRDARCGELCLDEAEPDGQFLFIVGAKLDLRGCCCRDVLNIGRMRHVLWKNKRRGSRDNCRGIPGRNKELGSPCEDSTKRNKCSQGQNKNGSMPWSCPCPTRLFAFLLQVSKWNLCEKTLKKRNVVALEMYTADWRWTCNVGERENERLDWRCV